MARILLTWELGSGFGHVASLSSIADGLRRQGHEVVAALRDPNRGMAFFAPIGVRCLASPSPTPKAVHRDSSPIATYADLLASVGFGSVESLESTVAEWDRIFTEVDPDVVVFDHSPFALLASMSWQFGKLQHGTGFYIPPDTSPLPVLRPWLLRDPQEAHEREAVVLMAVNKVLRRRGQRSFERLAELYCTAGQWLATYEELDHFQCSRHAPCAAATSQPKCQPRNHQQIQNPPLPLSSPKSKVTANEGTRNDPAVYHGITPPPAGGLQPAWPSAVGPRIFAYLQPDATSLSIVKVLAQLGYPAVVRIADSNPPLELLGSKSLHWVKQAVNVPQMACQCDLAVLSGGHGTLAAVLLAGKPVLIAPIQFEQLLSAQRCEKLGLGTAVPPMQVNFLADVIAKLLDSQSNRREPAAFAERYRSVDLQQQLGELISRIEQLVGRP